MNCQTQHKMWLKLLLNQQLQSSTIVKDLKLPIKQQASLTNACDDPCCPYGHAFCAHAHGYLGRSIHMRTLSQN